MGFGLFKKIKDRIKRIKPWVQKVVPKVIEAVKKATPVIKNILNEVNTVPAITNNDKAKQALNVMDTGVELADNIVNKRNQKVLDWTKQDLAPRLKKQILFDE